MSIFFPFGSFYTYYHYFTILEYRLSVDRDVQRIHDKSINVRILFFVSALRD